MATPTKSEVADAEVENILRSVLKRRQEDRTDKTEIDILYEQIVKIVGEDGVNRDEFQRILYSHDVAPLPKMMSLLFKMTPDLVVRPRNTEEVAKVVKLAQKKEVPIIPRGGGTWGLGGAVPTNGGIVLDMGALNNIISVDKENLTMTVEPGTTWKEVEDKALSSGMFLGAYPSSAPGASIGGWINTGGIGIGSYKYGGVDQQVRSMYIVLSDGKDIRAGFDKVMANSSGYNLSGLFMGSEGTLGVITKVILKLHPAPEVIKPVSFTFDKLNDMVSALFELTRNKVVPWHIAFLDGKHLEFLRRAGLKAPEVDGMLNLAFEGPAPIVDYEIKVVTEVMNKHHGKRMGEKFSEHEWNERYYELRAKPLGPTALVGEVFVPTGKMKEMVEGSRKIMKKMKIRAAIAGMMADRNTSVLMPYVLTDERKMVKSLATMAFIKKLGDLAFKLGGRPAGLGTFFSVNLKRMHGNGVETLFDIKASLDPYDIMNPGKLTEGVTRWGVPIPAGGFRLGMDMMGALKGMLPKDKEEGSN